MKRSELIPMLSLDNSMSFAPTSGLPMSIGFANYFVPLMIARATWRFRA
jgi:hypothetical protein